MKAEHVLIIRFSALGDVAMTVPVVYSLAYTYPETRFTVLSRPFARPFFENLAPNVFFMEADVKGEYHGIHGLNKLYRRLIAKNFTAVADLHDVLRSKYLLMRFQLGGYKNARIDKHREGKRKLCAPKNKVKKQQPTSFENYQDVFEKIGYPIQPYFDSLFGKEKGPISQLSSIIGKKAPGKKWIGIAPFAAHKGKIYPIEKMETVIANLNEAYPDCRIFFFGGGKTEMAKMDEWCERYHTCTNASKNLHGLSEELILMSHLDVMVSMDSGNMHLASLVNCPVVSIWGATHPYCGFMGWNQKSDDCVQIDLDCRPCSVYGNKPCLRGDYACLNNITPQQIVDKVASHLV